ncbi:MAG: hypothetical protein ACOX4D_02735 [Bacteroidales bacterium]|jgi:hypothetical protein
MKALRLIGKIVSIALIILGAIFGIWLIATSKQVMALGAGVKSIADVAIYIAYISLALAILAVIASLFFKTYTKKSVIKTIIVLVGVIVLLAICWAIPGVTLPSEFLEGHGLSVKNSRLVDVGLYFTYILFAAAIITIIYAAISNFIKNR